MNLDFTAHNIRLDDGTFTISSSKPSMTDHAWYVSARRVLELVFPGDKRHLRLVDLGCLEGGYAVEFARMGFDVLGIEVRESNIAACNYVKSATNLPNLSFVKDDAMNVAKYGDFDVVFCCGLLYHLDRPKQFLEELARVTKKLVILQTHFSTIPKKTISQAELQTPQKRLRRLINRVLVKLKLAEPPEQPVSDRYNLSPPCEHEGLAGQWFLEFHDDESFGKRETSKWASWDNRRSFWIQREFLLQTIQDIGFDLVMEQFDGIDPGGQERIIDSMLGGFYETARRGTFVGIKTGITGK